jgi:hypothetical protein
VAHYGENGAGYWCGGGEVVDTGPTIKPCGWLEGPGEVEDERSREKKRKRKGGEEIERHEKRESEERKPDVGM